MSTRDRIVEAAATAFRRQGYSGTGLKQITAESDAPFGSLYHFFPGGKAELAAASLRWAGAGYQELVESTWDAAADPVTATRDVFEAAADLLEATDYADACPIATVALEVASTNEPLRVVTAEIFDSWHRAAVARLVPFGVSEEEAGDLATVLIATLEGGYLLSRAARSTAPMRTLGHFAADAVARTLDVQPRSRKRRARAVGDQAPAAS